MLGNIMKRLDNKTFAATTIVIIFFYSGGIRSLDKNISELNLLDYLFLTVFFMAVFKITRYLYVKLLNDRNDKTI